MSTADEPKAPEDIQTELRQVTYVEEKRDPNWWRTYVMSPEEIERRKALWHKYWSGENWMKSLERLALVEGGGFSGRGITDAEDLDWPRSFLIYIPPLKGYWSEARKKQTLQTLDQIYSDIKREIEHA